MEEAWNLTVRQRDFKSGIVQPGAATSLPTGRIKAH